MAWPSRRKLATWKDELLAVQGGGEGSEERIVSLHTEVCEKREVTSSKKGVTSNASEMMSATVKDTMSANVKLAKKIEDVSPDIGQPAECQWWCGFRTAKSLSRRRLTRASNEHF